MTATVFIFDEGELNKKERKEQRKNTFGESLCGVQKPRQLSVQASHRVIHDQDQDRAEKN
jgi:hypothetical protein